MNKWWFVVKNLLKSFLWLAIFLVGYLLIKPYFNSDLFLSLEPIFDNKILIFLIFLISEVIIGIIPPEMFLLWAAREDILFNYILLIALLAFVSYLAGVCGYFVGRYLNTTLYYRYFRIRFLRKMERRFNSFGLYLIIIAALTPVPFSGVAMLIGSVRYPLYKYLIFSVFRFLRFAIYAWVFWEAKFLV